MPKRTLRYVTIPAGFLGDEVIGPNKHRVAVYISGTTTAVVGVKFGERVTAGTDGMLVRSGELMNTIKEELVGDNIKSAIFVWNNTGAVVTLVEISEHK